MGWWEYLELIKIGYSEYTLRSIHLFHARNMCILCQWKKQKENPEHLNILSFLRIKLRIYISHYTHVWCIRYIARISLSCLTLNQVYVLLAKYAHFAQTTRDAQPIQINFAHILKRARDSTPFSRDTNIYIYSLLRSEVSWCIVRFLDALHSSLWSMSLNSRARWRCIDCIAVKWTENHFYFRH